METKYLPKFTKKPPSKELLSVSDIEALKKIKAANDHKLLVLILWKKENEQSIQMKGVCEELAKQSDFCCFVAVLYQANNQIGQCGRRRK